MQTMAGKYMETIYLGNKKLLFNSRSFIAFSYLQIQTNLKTAEFCRSPGKNHIFQACLIQFIATLKIYFIDEIITIQLSKFKHKKHDIHFKGVFRTLLNI